MSESLAGPVARAMLAEAAELRARADKLERAAGMLDESGVTASDIERTRQLLAEGKIPLMPHEELNMSARGAAE